MAHRPFITSANVGRRGNRPTLGGAQLGRSGPWVACHLVVIGDHGAFRKYAKRRRWLRKFGRVARAATNFAVVGEKRFDDTVLERVERYDHQPTTALENAFGGLKRRDQFAKLIIYKDA
jgi:hypothetical protein